MRCSGATSPSMEYRLSHRINFGRSGPAARSNCSRCSMSLWRQTCFSVPDLRTPSIMELWLSASESSRQFGSSFAMVEMPVSFETYPDAVSYTHLRAHETDSYLVCR